MTLLSICRVKVEFAKQYPTDLCWCCATAHQLWFMHQWSLFNCELIKCFNFWRIGVAEQDIWPESATCCTAWLGLEYIFLQSVTESWWSDQLVKISGALFWDFPENRTWPLIHERTEMVKKVTICSQVVQHDITICNRLSLSLFADCNWELVEWPPFSNIDGLLWVILRSPRRSSPVAHLHMQTKAIQEWLCWVFAE